MIRDASVFSTHLRRHLKNESAFRRLRSAVQYARDWRARLRAIRALYDGYRAAGEDHRAIDPYELGLNDFLTPIEWMVWQDIRGTDGLQFLPQYPVGRFFIDFGDPERRLGIEVDGRQFHDIERDRMRDQQLWNEHGWKVYRISGAEAYRVRLSPHEWKLEYRERHERAPSRDEIAAAAMDYYSATSTGVVRAIREIEIGPHTDSEHIHAMTVALRAHRLVDFPIGAADTTD